MVVRDFYLDTETTGLDAVKNDIIQFGIIIEINGKKKEEYQGFCRPFNMDTVSPDALRVNKRGIDEIKHFPDPKDTFVEIVQLMGKYFNGRDYNSRYVIHGQNPEFDLKFFRSFFYKNGYGSKKFHQLFDYKTIDLICLTNVLRRKGIIPPNSNLKLETMVDFFGVTQDKKHDALADIQSTYTMFHMIRDIFIKRPEEVDMSLVKTASPLHDRLVELRGQNT